MKIKEVLKKKKKHETISSKKAGMYYQNRNTLVYWLCISNVTGDKDKLKNLDLILKVDDWQIDKE